MDLVFPDLQEKQDPLDHQENVGKEEKVVHQVSLDLQECLASQVLLVFKDLLE